MPEPAADAVPAPARPSFGARLQEAMDTRGQLCVGIDPHPGLLAAWGLNDDAAALERFSLTVLEAVGEQAAAVKPQVALFERHGSAGLAALERVLAACSDAGVLSIADAKRGDIGSTMAAYADAWLRDGSALAADALTVSPYLGFESLRPALDLAQASGRGVFVLGLTSNPEGASVQHVGGDHSVAAGIVDAAAAENSRELGRAAAAGASRQLGSTGLVIGATVGTALTELGIHLAAAHTPVLAPGLGAQGATGADLRATFGAAYPNVLATSSRDILKAGPSPAALRGAARQTLAGLAG
ncbi:orotidine-5'-phosphate decarboxylase [Arthrobacter sunyaminii]|uniref:Orotidine 5'-phosphate decarboxylase n=1 Tax=Arthrobacter sunyaminii TaxID=2816859 RepID=A0A975S908_9MICC|nr:orotidine-5'-phosphate decarboxylase [Arthrobacter sunyaminii]MBO0895738.1 orotidine-5'-phosphate decarboxylase [Arthrobacter sunyaminii]MBO0907392.1 orotidine-5'-phosphate decarboxylase [Arthrobacter sunyaminii]QWQ38011.1 orotidine-5'-phosphate decarboxylase [Arthrobacter sunyaminii]